MLEERRSSAMGSTRRRRVHLNNGNGRHRSSPPATRQILYDYDNDSHHTIYDAFADMDLEDVLVMEAIRLSLVTANAVAGSGTGDQQQQSSTL
jgi:hypothetical protein